MPHIFPKPLVTWNNINSQNLQRLILSQFFVPHHVVWSILFRKMKTSETSLWLAILPHQPICKLKTRFLTKWTTPLQRAGKMCQKMVFVAFLLGSLGPLKMTPLQISTRILMPVMRQSKLSKAIFVSAKFNLTDRQTWYAKEVYNGGEWFGSSFSSNPYNLWAYRNN